MEACSTAPAPSHCPRHRLHAHDITVTSVLQVVGETSETRSQFSTPMRIAGLQWSWSAGDPGSFGPSDALICRDFV